MKKTIQVKLDKDDIVKLVNEAEKNGHSISSFVRYLIKKFLEKKNMETL